MEELDFQIRKFREEKIEYFNFDCRRHRKGFRKPYHMGFYEQNLKGSLHRTWKLYEATDKNLLRLFKPILQVLSETIEPFLEDLPCPKKFGLFGTIFTTIVVNFDISEWHVDPKDKFAILLYFGDFSQGCLCVGPPINKKIPVSPFDFLWLLSGEVFHKAENFKGIRINVSCYCKKTTEITTKGRLQVFAEDTWALWSK